MIYLFLTYILFQAGFDHWAGDTVTWKAVYYAFQFGWVAALAVVQMFKGRHVEFYFVFAVIMAFISISFFSWINLDPNTFTMMTSGPPAYMLTSLAVLLFGLILVKKIQWNGLKKLGRSH
jgi:hypothetical protein